MYREMFHTDTAVTMTTKAHWYTSPGNGVSPLPLLTITYALVVK